MGEDTEDVKPKIDLTINYDGQSQYPSRGVYTVEWGTHVVRVNDLFLSQRARLR